MDSPHVVILPFPAQGHIKPMLMLAELLAAAGLAVSFVNSERNHRRIVTDEASFRPGIKFLSIPDGLPSEHPRTGTSLTDLFLSMPTVSKPAFKNLIASMSQMPACIICDGITSFAIDVAAELGIPAIAFRTYSATCTWTFFHLQRLIEAGEIPIALGSEDMDRLISYKIPGLENRMRYRDLPRVCRLQDVHPFLQFYISQASKMRNASALILNTFEELEAPIISHLHSIYPAVYAVGPLHLHAALNPGPLNSAPHNSFSLVPADKSCIEWLDSQRAKSVLYVSFGSVVELTRNQLMEFWYGVVNSGKKFLWAIRPGLVVDGEDVPEELKMCTKERGLIVGWVPQEMVLGHDAVGGFLTHSGWNSVLEGISAGKPMLCWPVGAEQHVNSRCVEEMWKVGLDMKDICDRSGVEKMVRDLMEGRRGEIVEPTDEISRLARGSIQEGGSSHRNVKKLVQDIRLLHSSKVNS